jgi:hypothetical protein
MRKAKGGEGDVRTRDRSTLSGLACGKIGSSRPHSPAVDFLVGQMMVELLEDYRATPISVTKPWKT